jgi:CRISPR system Cascade subunit CasA
MAAALASGQRLVDVWLARTDLPSGLAIAAKANDVPFSLIEQPWIPVRRRSGAAGLIRPADFTDNLDDDPVAVLDWARPEQRVACLELLIGMLATAFPPAEPDGWERVWRSPPSPDALHDAFAPLNRAFLLDGDGPRFMQDPEDFEGERRDAETLRVETRRERSIRERVESQFGRHPMPRPEFGPAAMALYCLQRFAAAGNGADASVLTLNCP